jgi:recombination protein RecT
MGSLETIKSGLIARQRQIVSLVDGDKQKADRLMATFAHIASLPSFASLNPDAVLTAMISAATLDLSLDPTIGEAYIVAYKQTPVFMPSYKGWREILARSGWEVKARAVFACDDFALDYSGWNEIARFVPNFDDRNEGDPQWAINNLRGVLVLMRRDGETRQEFVSAQAIEKMRRVAPSQKGAHSGVWRDWFVEMAIAKAVKKAVKQLPRVDIKAKIALALDDSADSGRIIDVQKSIETGVITTAETIENADKAAAILGDKPAKQTAIVTKEEVAELTEPIEAEIDGVDYDKDTGEVKPDSKPKPIVTEAEVEAARVKHNIPANEAVTPNETGTKDNTASLTPNEATYHDVSGRVVLELIKRKIDRRAAVKVTAKYPLTKLQEFLADQQLLDDLASEASLY